MGFGFKPRTAGPCGFVPPHKDASFPWIITNSSLGVLLPLRASFRITLLMEFLLLFPFFPCVSEPLPLAKLPKAPDSAIYYSDTRNVTVPAGSQPRFRLKSYKKQAGKVGAPDVRSRFEARHGNAASKTLELWMPRDTLLPWGSLGCPTPAWAGQRGI